MTLAANYRMTHMFQTSCEEKMNKSTQYQDKKKKFEKVKINLSCLFQGSVSFQFVLVQGQVAIHSILSVTTFPQINKTSY